MQNYAKNLESVMQEYNALFKIVLFSYEYKILLTKK